MPLSSIDLPVAGGNSLYFGNTRTGTTAGNKNTDGSNVAQGGGPLRNIDFPGGAHGTVVSNEFSLEGYDSADKPTLYFNYFLQTENAQYIYGTNPDTLMRDSLRVFVADENGQWNLLVTNNSLHDSVRFDEQDIGPGGGQTLAPVAQSFVDVVEAFDNTNGWRQARIDLSNYAGRAGLKLRFDFTTAGSMNVGDLLTTGSELYAVPATELTDGNSFTISGNRFEFDMGAHLTVPTGGSLAGQTFTVLGNTFRYTATPTLPTDILVLPTDSAETVAQRTNAVINSVLVGTTLNVPNANQLEGESFTILGTTFTYTATPLSARDILAIPGDSANTMAARTVAKVNSVLGAGTAFLNGTQADFPSINSITFGSSLNTASGASMEGESVTFNGSTFTFTANPLLPTDIPISPFDSASTVATSAVTVINTVLGPGSAFIDVAAPSRISIPVIPNAASAIRTGGTLVLSDVLTSETLERESITLNGTTFTYTATPALPNDILAVVGDTADVIALRTRNAFNAVFGPGTSFVDPLAPGRVNIPVINGAGNALIRGGTLITSPGDFLQGHEFQLNGVTFRYSTNPATTSEILARPGDSAAVIASRTVAVVNNVLGTGTAVANGNQVAVRDLSATGDGFFIGGTLQLVDATAVNYEGESFTAWGTTFTFRNPAAAPALNAPGVLIDAADGDTAATLAARVVAAVNAAAGRIVAIQSGSAVEIAGATSVRSGGTIRVTAAAAADLDNDTIEIGGLTFVFVNAAPTNAFQIQSDANATVVAGRIVTAVNTIFGAGTAASTGAVVSLRNDTTINYTNTAAVGLVVIDQPSGTPLSFTLSSKATASPLFADNSNSPLGVDARGTSLTHDAVGSTLTVSLNAFASSYVTNNRITIPSAPGITLPGGSPLVASGSFGVSPGSQSVSVFPGMTANEVAAAVRQAVADVFAAGDIRIIKSHENRIQIIGQTVNNAGPLKVVTSLPGDSFGAFTAGFVDGQATRPGSLRGMANTVEGVYIDDIIIGFAERGEMVTNAPATAAFIPNNNLYDPERPLLQDYLGIASGAYDVEIRRATDFGVSQTPEPSNVLYRSIDTNDRETEGISITVPSAELIPHNSTFSLTDGWRSVTFQFIDQSVGLSALIPGNIPLLFESRTAMSGTYQDNNELIARTIVTAINSQAVQDVLRIQAMYSDTASNTSRQIHLTGNATITPDALLAGLLPVRIYSTYGDLNRHRDQGQIIVQSSTVRNSQNFGINVDAAVRGGLNPTPHPGSVKNTQEENTARLVTGIVIMNNVIASNASGGIRFSGDGTNSPLASVAYGRIVNNTIVGVRDNSGNGTGTGILVNESASPTLLNNIVADFGTGILVDASSQTAGTTIGATLYRGNGTPFNTGGIGAGTFPITLAANAALFVDQTNNNYYLAPFSQAIDSSLNSLGDRSDITRVKGPLGLGVSPILAPSLDVYGQLRGDDDQVATPAGQGANVFIDRGAIDRVDFFRPTAVIAIPEDQSSIDYDPAVNAVSIAAPENLLQLKLRLLDEGIGIDDDTVSASQFRVDMDGTTLQPGVDYVFSYNSVTNEVIFSAVTRFESERRYTITVDNDNATVDSDGVSGVRDRAGNFITTNEPDGTTKYRIVVTDGINDPPVNLVPGTQSVNEDTTLVFSSAGLNAIRVSDSDARLRDNKLVVTLTAVNGLISLSTTTGLETPFIAGDGTDDVTMTFRGDIAAINAALEGMTFKPTPDFFGTASITISTDDEGRETIPPAAAQQDSDVITINVLSVNDPPSLNPITSPAAINEDAGTQTISNFITGMSAGPAGEPTALTAEVTVISTTGFWNAANFFAPGGSPVINAVTGQLTFTTAADVNGTATVRVILRDSDLDGSIPQTFVITVSAINDEPVFTFSPAASSIVSLEDAGTQSVGIISAFAAGPATALDEMSQTLTWVVGTPSTLSGNLDFDLLEVQADGTLRYRAKSNLAGSALFSLSLMDSGSGISPNDNLSGLAPVTISVTQVNDRPVAVTGPYKVDEGYQLVLDASGSIDVDMPFGDSLIYAWDLNGIATDGTGGDGFETLTSGSAVSTLSWAYLQSIGITAPATYNIRLRVTDTFGPISDITTSVLQTLIVDFGDAPNSYGTLKASNGAAHTITGPLWLGTVVDKEITGQPTANAQGDDLAGSDDEDGVVFNTSLETSPTLNLPAFFTVTASAAGKLDVWLDLNNNGVFDHPSEHLNGGTSYNVVAGSNRIDFVIPAGTAAGDSMMRFRLSTAGSLQPTGRANDGEVEDYSVKIRALQAPVPVTITKPVDAVPGDGIVPQTSDLTPRVEWTLHDPNYYYDVQVRNAGGTVVFSESRTTNLQTDVSTLPAGRGYTVTVTPYNRADVAAASTSYEFDVVPLVVTAPVGDQSTHRPTVSFNSIEGSKTYTIQIVSQATNSVVHTGSMSLNPQVPGNNPTTYAVPIDLPLGQYRVRVRATDAADLDGDWSAFSSFFVKAPPVITAPSTGPSLRPTVTWTAVPGAVSYRIQLDNVTDNIRPVFSPLPSGITTTSWTPPADLRLGQYTVWVQAFNALGESSNWSIGRSFSVLPQATANLPGGRLNDSTPTFGWNAVPGADRYELVVRRGWGDNAIIINQTNLTTTSYTQPTDLPLGRYTYQVRAVNRAVNPAQWPDVASAVSPVYNFVVATAPEITAPASTVFDNTPTVSWINPLGSERSDIWVQQVGGTYEYYRRFNLDGTTHEIDTVFPNGNYVVWVRTWSNTDNPLTPADEREPSNWSLGKSFRISTPPTLLGPSGRTPDATPTLTWQGVPGGQTYEVWVDNNTVPLVNTVNQTGLNTLSYTIPSDLPIGSYTYWVRARNAFGVFSNWSAGTRFEVVAPPVVSGPPASTFVTTPSFTWNDMSVIRDTKPAGANSYEFQLEILNPATQTYADLPAYRRVGLTTTSLTVSPALAAGTYRASVRAKANGRTGVADTLTDYSVPIVFSVGGQPVVNQLASGPNTTPTITWQQVGGASGYHIWISLASTPNVPLIQVNNLGAASYNVSTPLAKGNYRVWVRSINAANGSLSAWSVPMNFSVTSIDAPQQMDQLLNSEAVYAILPSEMTAYSTSTSAVSMLPAIVVKESEWPVLSVSGTELSESGTSHTSQTAGEQNLPADTSVEPTELPETDAVLSSWDAQTWWNNAPVETTPSKPSSTQHSAGILGALLALTPRSLRRRRREE